VSPITPPRFTVEVLAEWAKGRLTADGWVQEKPCRVTIDHRLRRSLDQTS
jgi:hypothetical protein